MIAKELFEQGRVREAEQALSVYLRDHPTDTTQRTFLFELLCFSGEFERAEKHLGVLGKGTPQSELAAMLYFSALHAEKTRHDLFEKEAFPRSPAPAPPPGRLNGKPFAAIADADSQIGARIEVFAGGSYMWLPFAHLASLEIQPLSRLRDMLWAPAILKAAAGHQEQEFGEVLVPMIYPFSWKCEDESVWLGRSTVWDEDAQGNVFAFGHKLLLVDGAEIPFSEVHSLEFDQPSTG